jgi:hypothetical protein
MPETLHEVKYQAVWDATEHMLRFLDGDCGAVKFERVDRIGLLPS